MKGNANPHILYCRKRKLLPITLTGGFNKNVAPVECAQPGDELQESEITGMNNKQSSYGKSAQKESQSRRTKPQPRPEPSLPGSPNPPDGDRRLQSAELNARIAAKAYELFALRGGECGGDIEDWLEAERLVKAEMRSEK